METLGSDLSRREQFDLFRPKQIRMGPGKVLQCVSKMEDRIKAGAG